MATARKSRKKSESVDSAGERPSAAGVHAEELPEAAASWVPVARLKPWVKNPRKNDEAAKSVAQSIIRFGFGAPIVARTANDEIIAGHTRTKAALLLPALWRGADEEQRAEWHPEAVKVATLGVVPVRFVDLDETKAKALALADNKLGELASWDDDLLADAMTELRDEGVDLTDLGWSRVEVDSLLSDGPQLNTAPVELPQKYSVIVDLPDERSQGVFLQEMEKRGLKCRAMTYT